MEQDIFQNTEESTNNKSQINLNLCRICASTSEKMCDIFSSEGIAQNLAYKINVYLPFKVTEYDVLPLSCCFDCISVISTWHKFILKSLETENMLQEIFRKNSNEQNCDAKTSPISDASGADTDLSSSDLLIFCQESKVDFKNQYNDKKVGNKLNEQPLCVPQDNLEGELFSLKCELGKVPKCFNDNNIISNIPSILLIELKEELNIDRRRESSLVFNSNSTAIENVVTNKEETVTLSSTKRAEEMRENPVEKEADIKKTNKTKTTGKNNHKKRKKDDQPGNKSPENKLIISKFKRQHQTKLDHEALKLAKMTVEGRVYYNCNICGKNLHSPYTYTWHRRIHSGEKPYVCDLCGRQFRVSQGLIRHLRETHEGLKNYRCDTCGRMFATKRNVEEHRRTHTEERPYVCDHCGKAFKQKATLFVHNRCHSDTYPYKCIYCNLMFRSRPPMLIHIKRHTGEKPYPCEICGRRFRTRYDLKKHTMVHSDEKPYSCTECGSSFRQKRYLSNHNKINPNCKTSNYPSQETVSNKKRSEKHKEKDIPKNSVEINNITRRKKVEIDYKLFCVTCNKGFTRNFDLKRHTIKAHFLEEDKAASSVPLKKRRRKKTEIDATFECELCQKKFTRNFDLLRHKRLKHPEKLSRAQQINKTKENNQLILKSKVVVNNKTFYECKVCGYKFSKSSNLVRHISVHTQVLNYSCRVCGKRFRLESALSRHINHYHLGIKKFACDICDSKFAYKYSLEDHKTIHLDCRPFVCDRCGKTFKNKGTLKRHNIIHSETYPFQCNSCGKKYKRLGDLKIHETLHSAYKRHCCHLCGITFRLKHVLQRHLSIHDKLNECYCSECGLKFRQEKYLKAHQKSHKNK